MRTTCFKPRRTRPGTVFLFLILGLLACVWQSPLLAQKKIALTFNDLPARGPFGYWRHREISNMILRRLEKHGIKGAGFVVQAKIEDNPQTWVVLDDWASRGHTLGNQSHSRVDYNQLAFDDFMEHVRDGQKITRQLGRKYRANYRYFRFPQLHQGNTDRKKSRIDKTLHEASYEIAHVTVKTSDHRFIRPYLEHENDPEVLAKLKGLFLGHVSESLDYAESQAKKVFDRNIHHILLLRCNIATASFLKDLILLLTERGYEFVSLAEALTDTVYRTPENYVGPLGLSFIDRVAASKGLPYEENQGELRRGDVETWLEK